MFSTRKKFVLLSESPVVAEQLNASLGALQITPGSATICPTGDKVTQGWLRQGPHA